MAGIYLHIPFCRQKCYYCDFYKTVNTSLTSKFITALQKEIILQKNYLSNENIETIYFGGGTPSVLKINEINQILSVINQQFKVSTNVEITLEANPDDLSKDYLNQIYQTGIHRLSIGIQSFQDKLLKKMNRRHNSGQALKVVENAVKTGFNNISVDLIYGLPGLTNQQWVNDLENVFKLPVQHLSAYHLTYHKGTAFYTWLKKGSLKALNENESISQFKLLVQKAKENDFEQYEISNFAKDRMYSKHNSFYWMGIKYLGLGPSAHSYNGISRRWNVANVESYIKAIDNGLNYWEEEILNEANKYNEYILTRIRTIWGVSLNDLTNDFGVEKAEHFVKNIKKYINNRMAIQNKGIYTLTEKGMFVSDEIMTNLMYI